VPVFLGKVTHQLLRVKASRAVSAPLVFFYGSFINRQVLARGGFAADKACWATYHAAVWATGRKPACGDVV
jgi:hypothetical protein